MFISPVQRSESARRVYIYPVLIGFPFHSSGHRALSPRGYAVGSHPVSVLHKVSAANTRQPQSPGSSYPRFPPLVSIPLFSTSASSFFLS